MKSAFTQVYYLQVWSGSSQRILIGAKGKASENFKSIKQTAENYAKTSVLSVSLPKKLSENISEFNFPWLMDLTDKVKLPGNVLKMSDDFIHRQNKKAQLKN